MFLIKRKSQSFADWDLEFLICDLLGNPYHPPVFIFSPALTDVS